MLQLDNIIFAHPDYLWGLLALIPLVAWYVWREGSWQASMRVSQASLLLQAGNTYKLYIRHLPFTFRTIALALLILALARPQSTDSWQNTAVEGIDIVITLDISGSMLARDFEPNRIEAAKALAKDFIRMRPNDRIGMVVFSGESFTQCPLTTDHSVLLNLIDGVSTGMINDGTAIGLGLASAVSRLKESEAVSKVIILLTDGVNNMGEIAPITAAEIATAFDMRVYTVGVGTRGTAPYPVQTQFGTRYQDVEVEIDENMLTEIAEMTGGAYFRATDNRGLKAVYEKIDQLEKSKIDVTEFSRYEEEFLPLAIAALSLLLLEVLLRNTLLRSLT